MKKILFLLFSIFCWLQYSLWFGKHGICDFFRIKNNIEIRRFNELRISLRFRNNQLFSEIYDLVHHQEASVEERARDELDMIKLDENFYYLISINRNNINK